VASFSQTMRPFLTPTHLTVATHFIYMQPACTWPCLRNTRAALYSCGAHMHPHLQTLPPSTALAAAARATPHQVRKHCRPVHHTSNLGTWQYRSYSPLRITLLKNRPPQPASRKERSASLQPGTRCSCSCRAARRPSVADSRTGVAAHPQEQQSPDQGRSRKAGGSKLWEQRRTDGSNSMALSTYKRQEQGAPP
jgi:hypothetical protein